MSDIYPEKSIGAFCKKSVIIIGAIGVNIAGAHIVQVLNIPLYLDSVATFSITASFGLIPGIITAIATNTLLALLNRVGMPFVICHILTAIGAWIVFRKLKINLTSFLWAGLISAFSNGIIGSVISYMVFDGVTTIPQIDNLILGIFIASQNIGIAVYWGGVLSNLVDKGLSAALGFLLYKMIVSLISKRQS